MKTIEEIFVKTWLDEVDVEAIKEWAYIFIDRNDDIPQEVFELLEAKKYDYENLILNTASVLNEYFSPQSLNNEILAAKYLVAVATDYLNDETTPMDVCRVITNIDTHFIDAPRDLPDNIAYYPIWLGNLYNSCDWCDETWTDNSVTPAVNPVYINLGDFDYAA
nr:hypothetical protein [uncultured Psychrobacter sp.]